MQRRRWPRVVAITAGLRARHRNLMTRLGTGTLRRLFLMRPSRSSNSARLPPSKLPRPASMVTRSDAKVTSPARWRRVREALTRRSPTRPAQLESSSGSKRARRPRLRPQRRLRASMQAKKTRRSSRRTISRLYANQAAYNASRETNANPPSGFRRATTAALISTIVWYLC